MNFVVIEDFVGKTMFIRVSHLILLNKSLQGVLREDKCLNIQSLTLKERLSFPFHLLLEWKWKEVQPNFAI